MSPILLTRKVDHSPVLLNPDHILVVRHDTIGGGARVYLRDYPDNPEQVTETVEEVDRALERAHSGYRS